MEGVCSHINLVCILQSNVNETTGPSSCSGLQVHDGSDFDNSGNEFNATKGTDQVVSTESHLVDADVHKVEKQYIHNNSWTIVGNVYFIGIVIMLTTKQK